MSRFSWLDPMSVDPPASAAFFTDLFGWTEIPIEIEPSGTYRHLSCGGEVCGGILPLDPGLGHPSHWVSYVDVGNLDAVTARAVRLGGAIASPPAAIPDAGRFAALTDRQGALFCALQWHPGAFRPAAAAETPGAVAWNELLSADPASAAAFYSKLFSWEQRPATGPRGAARTMIRKGVPEASIVKQLAGTRMSAWLIYFEIEDLDLARARVTSLGGRVVSEAFVEPGIGRLCYAADPTEAGFGLVQSER